MGRKTNDKLEKASFFWKAFRFPIMHYMIPITMPYLNTDYWHNQDLLLLQQPTLLFFRQWDSTHNTL